MTEESAPTGGGPLLSVVIPAHNRAHLIGSTVRTAMSQDAEVPFEVIVVDDHSDDDTAGEAERAGARVVKHAQNLGPGAARNSAIAVADGEWVAFLDSDDVWWPGHLGVLWAHRTGVDLVATSAVTATPAGWRVVGSPSLRAVRLDQPSDVLRPENIIPTSACMIRAEVLRRTGGFKAERYAEDLEMWMHVLSLSGTHGLVVPAITVGYRSHAGQTVRTTEMSLGTEEMLRQLQAVGWLSPRTADAVRTVGAWDRFRGQSVSRIELRTLRAGASLPALVALIWGRTLQKHRWRLQPWTTKEVLALLA